MLGDLFNASIRVYSEFIPTTLKKLAVERIATAYSFLIMKFLLFMKSLLARGTGHPFYSCSSFLEYFVVTLPDVVYS